jgi:hypothetical protein
VAQGVATAGEQVVDVPAQRAVRAGLLKSGHARKTEALDAASVAAVVMHHLRLRRGRAEDDDLRWEAEPLIRGRLGVHQPVSAHPRTAPSIIPATRSAHQVGSALLNAIQIHSSHDKQKICPQPEQAIR